MMIYDIFIMMKVWWAFTYVQTQWVHAMNVYFFCMTIVPKYSYQMFLKTYFLYHDHSFPSLFSSLSFLLHLPYAPLFHSSSLSI